MTSAALFSLLLLAAGPARAGHVQLLDPDRAGTGSATPAGDVPCGGAGSIPSLSADGRYAVYVSRATTLVAGQTDVNGTDDIFLFDRVAGTTTLVSHSTASPVSASNGRSFMPAISRDARWIAWSSLATDLIPGYTGVPNLTNIYLYDRLNGTTTLVTHSASSPTQSGCLSCLGPSLSADGRYMVFTENLTNIAVIILYDRESGTFTLVNHTAASPNDLAIGQAGGAVMSGDGNSVVYYSAATDLVTGQADTNARQDVFLWDRLTGANVLVSHAAASLTQAGDTGITFAWPLQISFDGRWVAHVSASSDLVANTADSNGMEDVFLWDRTTGLNTLVSLSAVLQGHTANGGSVFPHLSPDGRWLAFSSTATDLAAGVVDANRDYDAFLYDRDTGTLTLLSPKSGAPGSTANGFTGVYRVSDDGLTVSLQSAATDLAPGLTDHNGVIDSFLLDRGTGGIELVSRSLSSPTVTASGGSSGDDVCTALSADGRVVLFQSQATDLVAGDRNGAEDAFAYIRDLQDFFTVTPCRLFDTRQPQNGPALTPGVRRTVAARGACGIPATARALAVNVTAVAPTGAGELIVYSGAGSIPLASTLSFVPGVIRANNAVVLMNADGSLALQSVSGSGTVHVVIDVAGYFE
jgi:Tol biopolymer transport system component